MHYMYDDPPKKDNFVDPYYRPRRTVTFKTDHQQNCYLNPGHLQAPGRDAFVRAQQARVYTSWEPPRGGEAREGKKILGERPINDGRVMKEQD